MQSSSAWAFFLLFCMLVPFTANALTPPASSSAPLPEGVAPSHTLVSGIYVRSESTGMSTGGTDTQTAIFNFSDKFCQALGLGGAKVVQGKLEDLAQPTVAQAYFSGSRTASYIQSLMLIPDKDDTTRCSFRVVSETTRVLKVFNGSQTIVTTTDRRGTRTQSIPGDMRPPGIEQLAGKPMPPGSGWQQGAPDQVAGVPCHHWTLDAVGTKFVLCVPDPGSLPPPLDRASLGGHIGKGDIAIYDGSVKELTTASPIDEAVFDAAAWGRRR